MGYMQAKSDLAHLNQFRNAVVELCNLEAKALKQAREVHTIRYIEQEAADQVARGIEGYQELRERVTQALPRTTRIAERLEIPFIYQSFPAPMVGGAVIPVNMFQAVVNDNSYGGIDRQWIYDAISQTIGRCEEVVAAERRNLVNPIYWLKNLVVSILRIPFVLIEATGFDVGKVEDHLLGRVFKLLELAVILYVVFKLGLTKEQQAALLQILIKLK